MMQPYLQGCLPVRKASPGRSLSGGGSPRKNQAGGRKRKGGAELSNGQQSLGMLPRVLQHLAGHGNATQNSLNYLQGLGIPRRIFRCPAEFSQRAIESSGVAQNFRVPHRIFVRLAEFCSAAQNLPMLHRISQRLTESS